MDAQMLKLILLVGLSALAIEFVLGFVPQGAVP